MTTTFAKKKEIDKSWYVIDANGQALGRLATRIASVLMGKHKPSFTPFLDTGDFVIVVNAGNVVLTGKKETDKTYNRHSSYPGGMKQSRVEEVRSKHPERLIEQAVRGMLPKTRLGRAQIKKLKVYAGPEHPHEAQKPRPWEALVSTPDRATGGRTS